MLSTYYDVIHFVLFLSLPCKRVLLYSLAFLRLFVETLTPVYNINKKSTSRVIVGINISVVSLVVGEY